MLHSYVYALGYALALCVLVHSVLLQGRTPLSAGHSMRMLYSSADTVAARCRLYLRYAMLGGGQDVFQQSQQSWTAGCARRVSCVRPSECMR